MIDTTESTIIKKLKVIVLQNEHASSSFLLLKSFILSITKYYSY